MAAQYNTEVLVLNCCMPTRTKNQERFGDEPPVYVRHQGIDRVHERESTVVLEAQPSGQEDAYSEVGCREKPLVQDR
jgi:hypothetical protein